MRIKVGDASGRVLDWLVANCEEWRPYPFLYPDDWLKVEAIQRFETGGYIASLVHNGERRRGVPLYTSSQADANSIIDRERISVVDVNGSEWRAFNGRNEQRGSSFIEAGLRCYVMSKYGMFVEIPDDLGSFIKEPQEAI